MRTVHRHRTPILLCPSFQSITANFVPLTPLLVTSSRISLAVTKSPTTPRGAMASGVHAHRAICVGYSQGMASPWPAGHVCDRLAHSSCSPGQLITGCVSNDSDRENRAGDSPAYTGRWAAMPGKSRQRQTRSLCLKVGSPVRATPTVNRW